MVFLLIESFDARFSTVNDLMPLVTTDRNPSFSIISFIFFIGNAFCLFRFQFKYRRVFNANIFYLIRLTISSERGRVLGENLFTNFPFSSIRYLVKFQLGPFLFHPFCLGSVSQSYTLCFFDPFTFIFS